MKQPKMTEIAICFWKWLHYDERLQRPIFIIFGITCTDESLVTRAETCAKKVNMLKYSFCL